MKNKKAIYVLIPLVAIIWGLIIWRALSFRADTPIIHDYIPQAETREAQDTSHYVLKLDYRDPFLRSAGTTRKQAVVDKAGKSNNIKKINLPRMRNSQKPSDLQYRGIIRCNEQVVGLLEVRGQKKLVREQTVVGEYQVLSFGEDSLRIRYLEKEYVYGKQ